MIRLQPLTNLLPYGVAQNGSTLGQMSFGFDFVNLQKKKKHWSLCAPDSNAVAGEYMARPM